MSINNDNINKIINFYDSLVETSTPKKASKTKPVYEIFKAKVGLSDPTKAVTKIERTFEQKPISLSDDFSYAAFCKVIDPTKDGSYSALKETQLKVRNTKKLAKALLKKDKDQGIFQNVIDASNLLKQHIKRAEHCIQIGKKDEKLGKTLDSIYQKNTLWGDHLYTLYKKEPALATFLMEYAPNPETFVKDPYAHSYFTGYIINAVKRKKMSLEDRETFIACLPFIEKLDGKSAVEILRTYKEHPLRVVGYNKEFAIPFLKKLNADQIVTVLKSKIQYSSYPLVADFIREYPKESKELLDKLNPEQIADLFKTKVYSFGNETWYNWFWKDELHKFIPFLEKLEDKDLIEILKGRDYQGYPILASHRTLKSLLPFLTQTKEKNPDLFIKIFKAYFAENYFYAGDLPDFIKILKPILDMLPKEKRVEFFKISNQNSLEIWNYFGNTLFRELFADFEPKEMSELLKERINGKTYSSISQAVSFNSLQFLKKLDGQQITEILKLDQKDGDLALNIEEIAQFVLSEIDKKITKDQFIEILSAQAKSGKTAAHLPLLDKFLPILKALTPDQKFRVLQIRSRDGIPVIFNHNFSSETFKILTDNLSSEQLLELFKTKDRNNNPTFNPSETEVLKFLTKLTPQQFVELLKEPFSEGNTLLHLNFDNKKFNEMVKNRISANEYENLLNLMNKHLIPVRLYLEKPSATWLTKPKESKKKVDVPEDQLPIRAKTLSDNINKLFDALKFGLAEGEVSPMFLGKLLKKEDWQNPNKVNEAKATIKLALNRMMYKIEDRELWSGTSRDPKLRHAHYSEMLVNFEYIQEELERRHDPEQTASILIVIASTELDQRCSGGYLKEIEQAADLLPRGGPIKIEKILNNAAIMTLQRALDLTIQRLDEEAKNDPSLQYRSRNNVHVLHQMEYAVELVSTPDPYNFISLQDAQREVVKTWTPKTIVSLFLLQLEKLQELGSFSYDMLFDWFKEQSLPNFDFETLKSSDETILKVLNEAGAPFLEEAKIFEQGLIKEMKEQLSTQGFSHISEAFINLCTSPRGAALRSNITDPTTLSPYMQQLTSSFTDQEKRQLDTEVDLDSFKSMFDKKGLLPSGRNLLIFNTELRQLVARNKINNELRKIPNLPPKDIPKLLQIKSNFDNAIKSWANEHTIDFSPQTQALASKAIEESCRTAYANSFFGVEEVSSDNFRKRLTGEGVSFVLKKMGVLEQ